MRIVSSVREMSTTKIQNWLHFNFNNSLKEKHLLSFLVDCIPLYNVDKLLVNLKRFQDPENARRLAPQ
jgi:hypothetical protein